MAGAFISFHRFFRIAWFRAVAFFGRAGEFTATALFTWMRWHIKYSICIENVSPE
jgi:hypothetical protein